jgi:uncharacterized protein (TIGR02453 family)
MANTATPGAFRGFGAGLVDFYDGLGEDNSREYWTAHVDTYQRAVREPLEALAAALTAEFGKPKIFRPNRDLRFSADKRPYQEHAAITVGAGAGGGLYLQVGPAGLFIAGGAWRPARDQLDRWRHALDDERIVADLRRALRPLEKAGYPLDSGDPLKTAPRGWPRDHPQLDLLRRRSLTVSHTYDPAPWWHTTACLDRVRDGWAAGRSWNDWFERHVGPSTEPPPARPGQN